MGSLYRQHDDRIAVIVGSGPSLKGFRFSDLDDNRFVTFAINMEVFNRSEFYAPDFWVFSDHTFGTKHVSKRIHPRTRVLTSVDCWVPITNGRCAVWIDRTYVFEKNGGENWSINSTWLPMKKTTSTAALAMAAKMGFKRIILLGIDCFKSKTQGYYHDGRRKSGNKVSRSMGDLDILVQHEEQLKSWRIVHGGLKRWGWAGEVFQTSLASPLTLWPKKPWKEAVNCPRLLTTH